MIRMARPHVDLTCALIAAATFGMCNVPYADAAPTTVIHDCSGKAQVEPRVIYSVYCGDAAVIVTDLTWSSWLTDRADATGVEHEKTCVPTCAAGSVAVQPVSVRLYAPRGGEFTQIRLINEYGITTDYRLTGTAQR